MGRPGSLPGAIGGGKERAWAQATALAEGAKHHGRETRSRCPAGRRGRRVRSRRHRRARPVRSAPRMEYLVTMTTHVPDGTPAEAVDDVRAREDAHTRELAAQGHVLRLWRPPLAPGEWRAPGPVPAGGARARAGGPASAPPG